MITILIDLGEVREQEVTTWGHLRLLILDTSTYLTGISGLVLDWLRSSLDKHIVLLDGFILTTACLLPHLIRGTRGGSSTISIALTVLEVEEMQLIARRGLDVTQLPIHFGAGDEALSEDGITLKYLVQIL